MTHRVAGAPLDFAALRSDLEVPGDFAPDVHAEARAIAQRGSRADVEHVDATDIPLVTIDPAGSRDLDQAVHISADGDGHVVHYAIADVAAFVLAGGAIDEEAHRRGETLYLPDGRAPLHPPELSEDAASLLPGVVRPAVLWRIRLDGRGAADQVEVTRAMVRSVAQLDYAGVQAQLDSGTLPDPIRELPTVGRRRLSLARERHAINLDLPEQLVSSDGNGGWTITLRAQTPVEQYNAEISLLTGMCAAQLMLDHGYGLLRTVPPAEDRAIHALRRAARALHIDWPDGMPAGDVLDSVDRSDPRHMAFVEHAVSLLRGAAYVAFDGQAPEQPLHSGIGAPYTHVTAPLRRLVDRYTSEICLSAQAGSPVPEWVRSALPTLPEEMKRADQKAHQVDRAVVDETEAWLLSDRVGQVFDAVVIDAEGDAGTVVLDDPAVRARCDGTGLPIGERVRVRLTTADVPSRLVRFERVERSDQ
ncbi:MAG: RNB domain-containing ribonuclease [Jatrophihabitans sp.]